MPNSRDFEFADITVSMLGKVLTGLRGINYEWEQEKEHLYAQGNKPRSIQKGSIKPTGTLTLLKTEVDELNRIARAAGYKNIVAVPGKLINITVVYQIVEDAGIQTDILVNVEFTKTGDGMKQGDKFKEVELPFLFLDLKPA